MAKKTTKKAAGRSRPTRKAPPATRKSPRINRAKKGVAWTFPKNTLEEALRVARAIEDKNAGKPMRAADLVKAVGFRQTSDWRFKDLLKSSSMYSLTSGTGATATVSLDDVGEDVVAPSSPAQRQKALMAAFRNVEDFARVEEHYRGKRIPEDEYFENTLVRDFGIDRDRVTHFIKTFKANVNFLNLFDARGRAVDETPSRHRNQEASKGQTHTSRVREFLDTCFVMMPFGPWFDVYYKDVYIPAIKEAGFEPSRADELFSTGSVVEQIWEQIQKAAVLLADLSDKNANVFYELGLAHASCKPVVFTSNCLEDVPFDLRHLRVIIYDRNEPQWDAKLKKQITAYLKASKTDPSKSIPQPFRDGLSLTDQEGAAE